MRILTPAQMRDAERRTIDDHQVPSLHLMERAGEEVVAAIEAHVASRPGEATVLCGRGNNGGDGWVAARLIRQRGWNVAGLLFARVDEVAGDARVNLERAREAGVPVAEVLDDVAWDPYRRRLGAGGLVVDALFGTGLKRPLDGLLATVANDVNAAGGPVVAIDLPSGLLADLSRPSGPCPSATLTVTLGAPKLALALRPEPAGRVVVADIGIPAGVIATLEGPRIELLTAEAIRSSIPVRPAESHKGDYGRVAIVAGSRGRTGAARLAGLGALRAGAGLVTVAGPASCREMIAGEPEYMTLDLPDAAGVVTGAGLAALLAGSFDVVAAGPGLATGPGCRAIVHGLLDRAGRGPLVLDADALTVCAEDPGRLRGRPEAPVVITPHPGEMARLSGATVDDVQRDRIGAAHGLATSHGVHVVLKGARTVIARADGGVLINTTGNPGMATGGSGDVLTGVVAAWLAQVEDVGAAVALAVHLHGLAGDLAAAEMGETGVIARDIAYHLGRAVEKLTGKDDDR
ncbi:MAG: NAD(P)H-hydrate dehydratase [Acidobacteria bacterium]|nr:NAD(P)H-hydrate dehydratase [Acidobacteriota bacterium]